MCTEGFVFVKRRFNIETKRFKRLILSSRSIQRPGVESRWGWEEVPNPWRKPSKRLLDFKAWRIPNRFRNLPNRSSLDQWPRILSQPVQVQAKPVAESPVQPVQVPVQPVQGRSVGHWNSPTGSAQVQPVANSCVQPVQESFQPVQLMISADFSFFFFFFLELNVGSINTPFNRFLGDLLTDILSLYLPSLSLLLTLPLYIEYPHQ